MKNILVFAPHPDDGIIGCGGTIIKHTAQGNNVSIIYLTSGESGSLDYSKTELAKIREKEALKGSQYIGVNDLTFLRNPDGYLEYNKNTLIPIINLIKIKKPDIIFIPHKHDAHRDHIKTFELVSEAVTRAKSHCFQECIKNQWEVSTILCYEVWTPLQEISYSVDITNVIDKKIKALKLHKSQINKINYCEAIKGLNRYRGTMISNGNYCECFYVLKSANPF